MGMSDCPKCWDTLCCCGYMYKDWSIERLTELRDVLDRLIKEKGAK